MILMQISTLISARGLVLATSILGAACEEGDPAGGNVALIGTTTLLDDATGS